MTSSTMADDPRLIVQSGFAGWRNRVAHGDIGQLPVLIGLAIIWGFFGWATNLTFFNSGNMVDLTQEMAGTGTIAIGIVFVLLLGEIDLSVGSVSGLSAAIVAVLTVQHGLSGPVALVATLIAGAAIGLLQGFWFAKVGVPSFVVTLAGYLGWQGLQLQVLGTQGTFTVQDNFLVALAGTYFSFVPALIIVAIFVAYIGVSGFMTRRSRLAAGLSAGPIWGLLLRVAIVAVLMAFAVWYLGQDRGLPLAIVIMIGLMVVADYVLRRTRYGRMVFATGGNAEAARRAGIPVARVRMSVFVLAAMFAALGGILTASYNLSAGQLTGGGPVLLNAIAAAVIGGTSLFGGRGSVWSALLGILVIQSVTLGMIGLNQPPQVVYMVTAIVLLATVTIDAIIRRGQPTSR